MTPTGGRSQSVAPDSENIAAATVDRRKSEFWICILILVIAAAYGNSFRGAFVFDDIPSILENESIRNVADSLNPPGTGLTTSGRPLLNLTFAFNYAVSGPAPWSFHLLNLLVHGAAAFTLLAIIARTLRRTKLRAPIVAEAPWLAWAIALLWALHPLQVESVTYIVQRAESLAALFYLLTLYCFVRGSDSDASFGWLVGAWLACAAGVATKETVATAPIVVLLYDRAFVAGTLWVALRSRWRFYLGLAASWGLAGWLVWTGHSRGGTAGFGSPAQWWEYAMLQPSAIIHYVRLVFWPRALVFDYGPFQLATWQTAWIGAALLAPVLAATIWLLIRRPAAGFLAASFFLLLAPSSSIIPITTQVWAEHRMYLPLAILVCAGVLSLHRLCGRRITHLIVSLLAIIAVIMTWRRNQTYQSPLRLWEETVAVCPSNPRAHVNLGEILARSGRYTDAVFHFREAIRLQPNYVSALYNLGTVLLAEKRPDDALSPLMQAVALSPDFPEAAYNLGNAFAALQRPADAARYYIQAIRLQPDRAKVHYNLANALVALDRLPEAIHEYLTVVRLTPDDANAHYNLANALMQSDQAAAAIPHYETVLHLDPGDREAAQNLAEARRFATEQAKGR